MCSPNPDIRRASARAFSLIEVAMALGIVAFAFTALLGMLPVGLGLFRSATDTSVASRIVQKVSGDLQQADFDTLTSVNGEILYFDEQGTSVLASGQAIYWVRVSIFSAPQLPGGTPAGGDNLARVVIQVAHNPSGKDMPIGTDGTWKEQEGARLLKRSLFLARNTPQSGA